MSLASPYSEVYHAGDGVTTRFPFGQNFTAISDQYVKCIIYFENGTSCVPTFIPNITAGYIDIVTLTKPDGTVLTVPPVGSTVRVYRDVPEAQNVTASQLQNYTAKQLEKVFDSIVGMIQENTYTTEHKTVRLTETQRDVSLAVLNSLVDGNLLYWNNTKRQIVPTDYSHSDVVQCVGGLFFRVATWNQQNYLQWSINKTDWHSINIEQINHAIEEIDAKADSAIETANDAKETADDAMELAESFDARITQNTEDIQSIIEGGNIDEVTIQPNANNKWEVQAVKNRNTASGATQPVYDWVGTQAEYIDQDIASQHPDWLCYITDDMFNPGSTFVFEQGDAAVTWYVTHNLNKYPSVTVVDSAGTMIDCTVIYINSNECELRFNAAFKGTAYLN